MTQRSIILRKKLHELESVLADVFRLPLDLESCQRHQIIADDVQQRLIFLKNLLSAEIASQPHNAAQPQEIEEQLGELEAAFRRWDEYRKSSLDKDDYCDDSPSVCSNCALTFFDDDLGTNGAGGSGYWAGGIKREVGKYCGAFGSGIIVGAICVLSYSSYVIQYEVLRLPPT